MIWLVNTRPAEIFHGDFGVPAMSIMKSAVVALQAFAPWPVRFHSAMNVTN